MLRSVELETEVGTSRLADPEFGKSGQKSILRDFIEISRSFRIISNNSFSESSNSETIPKNSFTSERELLFYVISFLKICIFQIRGSSCPFRCTGIAFFNMRTILFTYP